jgi:anti-sigma regulatory factor (Ser/Thr protein kinase)
MPVAPDEVRDSVAQALEADHWKNGIEVISALPHWITLRVACRRMTADRLTRFVTELAGDVENLHRHDLATAFREVLLNAMEHGAGFDPNKVIEVAAVRTARAVVYYFKDPGPGFNPKAPGLVATEDDPLSHLTYREAEGKRAGGFGMLLTSKLVDEVHYNERGNEVFLVKHLDKLRDKKVAAPRSAAKKRVLPFSGAVKAQKA